MNRPNRVTSIIIVVPFQHYLPNGAPDEVTGRIFCTGAIESLLHLRGLI